MMEWLAKKVVAGLVNRFFGQYLEDINTPEVNDALLSGQVSLTNLKIRRDALSFLDIYYGSPLPVEVKNGTIGRISLTIPYSSFFTQPLVVNVEDVFVLVTPVVEYDEERERELDRARKRQTLSHLFPDPVPVDNAQDTTSLWGLLYNRIWNNMELHINSVHIRYEDTHSCPQPLVVGLCLQSLSADTTNHKWKKAQVDGNASTVNKVIDFVSASMYINPESDRQRLVKPHTSSELWHQYLQQGLNTFSINEEPFQFVLQPVRCKVKMRQQMKREARVPGLLLDAVIKDAALTLSHRQYIAITELSEAFNVINTSRRFLKYHPKVPLKRHAAEWWQYAAKAIIHEQIRPFSWSSITKHRSMYKEYTRLYKRYLLEGHNGELEADLMKLEDTLNLTNIVLARMHAKIRLSEDEPSLVRPVESSSGTWFSWLWNGTSAKATDSGKEAMDIVGNRRKNGPFTSLTEDERHQLHETLLQLEAPKGEMHKDDIDHKAYLSLQNVSFTLKDDVHDIALASLSGFVMSAENRYGVKYQKLSVKAESFNLEAANMEQELVYVIKLVDGTPSAGYGIAFSLDLERNPLNVASDYAVTMKLDPLELLYNQHACAEMIYFFRVPQMEYRTLEDLAKDTLNEVVSSGRAAMEYAIARHKTIHLDIDIKSPFIVLPEHGSIQKGGNVLVLDMGGLKVNSEIGGQTVEIENATRMELEEQLYDRLTITVSQLQILFADSGDEWRVHRSQDDSDSHLLPRVRVKIDLANSIYPEYRQQPRQKVDIHITPLKLSLSGNRLSNIVEFAHHLPTLQADMIVPDSVDSSVPKLCQLDLYHCQLEPNVSELAGIRNTLLSRLKKKMVPDSADTHATPPLLRHVRPLSVSDTISQTSLELEKYFSASDNSDDEEASWGKPVDLPGFEDNTSPHNMITVLSRFCIDEIVVSISRSSEHGERPYLMVKAAHLVLELAMMDYGPALQLTLGSLHLVDKYHHSPTGQYLELVSSPHQGCSCIATVLYRKVRANCPDFKTHFHSCEQSLVVDFETLNVVWHRGSIITLINFLTLLSSKLGHIEQKIPKVHIPDNFVTWLHSGPEDPPVPSGATKWSFSAHLKMLNLKLCDNDVDFLQAQVGGFQGECVFKANEKKIFRASLSEMSVDDVSDITLHSKIIEMEEEKVFDVKLVYFSPTHKGVEEIDTSPLAVNPDASLRIRIDRLQCVFLFKFFADLQRFMEPLLNREGSQVALKQAEKAAEAGIEGIVSGKKLSLSIDIHAPTILIPQKSDSPSLLVVSLGNLKVDNLFKVAPTGGGGVVENVLVELGPMNVRRAVMTRIGGLEMQEDILEPATLRADIKHSLIPQCRDLLTWDVSVHMGTLCVNLGQRDLNTILAVLSQNKAEAQFTDTNIHSQPLTPVDLGTPTDGSDDNMGKLQAFLTHSVDIYRIADALVSLDGLTVTLYTDMDEVLSSPVRDAATALCRFEVGEVEVHADMNSDRSRDVRLTLHSCDLIDVRPDNSYHVVKKIFGQYSAEKQMNFRRFSVSVPPLMDLMYKVSPNGDAAIEVSIERTRLNMSVSFALALYKYVNEAIPSVGSTSGGILNPGFVGDLGTTVDGVRIVRRPPSSVDSTSGYLSTVTSNTDDQKTLSFSLKVKRPEIVVFADPQETTSRVLVVRCEVHVDYSRHPGNESFHITLDGCQIFASMYAHNNQNPYAIMQPCDVEGFWVFRTVEEGVRAELKVSHIHLHLNPPVVHLLMDITEQLTMSLSPELAPFKLHLPSFELEDLWSPKPLVATVSPSNPDEERYIKPEYPSAKPQQHLAVKVSVITVSFEKRTWKTVVPVLLMKAALNVEMNDWSKLMYNRAEVQLQLSCYSEEFSTWEPVIEPVTEDSTVMKPWEALVRTVQYHAQPIGVKRKHVGPHYDSADSSFTSNRNSYISCPLEDSESSTDEEDQDNEMVVLKPHAVSRMKHSSTKRSTADLGSLSGYPLDSDSETEDGVLHKISNAFIHMFSSDSEGSEEEGSSDELEKDKDNAKDGQEESSDRSLYDGPDSPEDEEGSVFSPPQLVPDTVDGNDQVLEDADSGKLATCVFVDSRDHLEVSLTPHIMMSVYNLVSEYLNKPMVPQSIVSCASHTAQEIELVNEIGPNSKITVLAQGESDGVTKFEVLATAKYQEPDSLPSSPASSKSRSHGGSFSEEDFGADEFRDWDHMSLKSCPGVTSQSLPTDVPNMEPSFNQFCPSPVSLYQDITKHRLQITVPGFDDLTVFVGTRSRSRIFQLNPPRNDRRYHIIVTVQVDHHSTKVTVRSPLQILNDMPLPINVCFKKSILEMLGSSLGALHSRVVSPVNPFEAHVPMVTLQPDQVFTVPITVAYHSPLHIQPAAAEYGISVLGVWWKDVLSSTCPYLLTCKPKAEGDPEITAAVTIQEGIKLSSLQWEGLSGVLPSYTLRLSPPLSVYNQLPCTLVLSHPVFAQPVILDPGAQTTLYKVNLDDKVCLGAQVCNYLGSDWDGTLEIGVEKDDHRTLTLSHGGGSARRKLELALYTVRAGSTSVYVYSPYWIVNKTGLPLHIRGSRSKFIYDLNGSEDIVLFRYKRNYPHKLKIRVVESEWSRRWSCEAVGSCGVVVCTDRVRGKKYRMLAKVKQSILTAQTPNEGVQGETQGKLHLTKIVTLMPYFLMCNLTPRPLKFMQENDKVELWYDIVPHQCTAFWPDGENMHLVVRYRDQQVRSQHFHFNSNHTTVVRMEKGRALTVCVSGVGSNHPVMVTFDKYQAGDAPVRIENWCEDVHLRIHQKGSNQVHLLAPHQSQLYTWDDPTIPHELLWNIYNRKSEDIPAVIDKDDHGSKCVTVTSLKPGMVRTKSQSSVGTPKTRPKKLGQRQRAKTTISTSSTDSDEDVDSIGDRGYSQYLHPEDKSQLTKTRKDKILLHWVSYKQGSQRVLLFTQSDRLAATTRLPMERATLELCLAVEKIGVSLINQGHREVAYMSLMPGAAKWELEVDGIWKVPPSLELIAWLEDQYLHNKHSKVSLKGSLQVDLSKMYMTRPFSGRLRRTKQPALWFHYRHSQHYSYASAQVYRIQVDNQLMDAVFPTVLYPSNNSRTVHPCLSSCVLLHSASGQLTTIKHLSLVAKEFFLKLDKGFILSTYEVLEPLLPSFSSSSIHTELKKLRTPITFTAMTNQQTTDDGPHVERVCVAGLQVLFSFSPRGTVLGNHGGQSDVLEWFLTSLGATLTEMKNVSISVGHYERQSIPWDKLIVDFLDHAKYQIVQQVYVLVLGLDILGNPYQRLRDLSQGVKDLIYQPALGIIEGPDEFAEGIARGAQSLMGRVVGGTADSLNLISSALGNTIAVLSFDEEYRKKREQRLDLQSPLPVTLLHAGHTFVMGVVLGLSGVVVKPIAGAQQDGVEGFFRGLGRGIMGLITKPTLGVIDSVAMACDGIRRAVDLGHDVILRSRMPRHISPYIAMRPYSSHEAAGMSLLASLGHGRYLQTDWYIAHAALSQSDRPDVILISDKHIFKLERCNMWGGWDISWRVAVRNLLHQPTLKDNTILLMLRQDESHSQLSGSEHQIRSNDMDVLLYLVRWIEVLTTLHMVDQPCPLTQ